MNDRLSQKIVVSSTLVIIVIGALNGLMPFATDLYLPAFSQIAESLNTSVGFIAMTMSSFFAGSCIGQLLNGPILDKYGRKNPMIWGLLLFSITSIGCALATYVEVLIVLRFFQAVGISVCNVGGKAVVRDVFPPKETARIFSILGMVMGVSPIIAPSVGSWLLLVFGWESIFYCLAILSFLLIFMLWKFLPNTMQKDDGYAMTFGNIWGKYFALLKNKKYVAYALISSMGGAILFSWITSSSFIFMELLGLNEQQFGFVFAGTASCIMLSNQANILLLKKFKTENIILFAFILQLVICGFLLYTVQFNFTIKNMIICMCLLMLTLFMTRTNSLALALNSVEKDLGVATAFMGSFLMALSAFVTFVLSIFLIDSAMPMVFAIVGLTMGCLILQQQLISKASHYDRPK